MDGLFYYPLLSIILLDCAALFLFAGTPYCVLCVVFFHWGTCSFGGYKLKRCIKVYYIACLFLSIAHLRLTTLPTITPSTLPCIQISDVLLPFFLVSKPLLYPLWRVSLLATLTSLLPLYVVFVDISHFRLSPKSRSVVPCCFLASSTCFRIYTHVSTTPLPHSDALHLCPITLGSIDLAITILFLPNFCCCGRLRLDKAYVSSTPPLDNSRCYCNHITTLVVLPLSTFFLCSDAISCHKANSCFNTTALQTNI
jgi:hypothetical protein